jgi:hypothetical protein
MITKDNVNQIKKVIYRTRNKPWVTLEVVAAEVFPSTGLVVARDRGFSTVYFSHVTFIEDGGIVRLQDNFTFSTGFMKVYRVLKQDVATVDYPNPGWRTLARQFGLESVLYNTAGIGDEPVVNILPTLKRGLEVADYVPVNQRLDDYYDLIDYTNRLVRIITSNPDASIEY